MGQNSLIEWTTHTANLAWGCTHYSIGCNNCYAELLAKRYGFDIWGNDKPRREIKSVWKAFLKYQELAYNKGEIHRVFVGSMQDIFERPMPLIDKNHNPIDAITTGHLRDRLFREVIPSSPNLLFLLLTKRPQNINKYIPTSWLNKPPSNVMFGTSPVTQSNTNILMKHFLKVNGRKFLSVEPQLSEITLMPWLSTGKLDWVIQGGESGPHKRPFDINWGRKLRDECRITNTPYFFKQIDKRIPIPDDLMIREFPDT